MRNLIVASALALAAAAPSIASAEGVAVSAGATVASQYVSTSGAKGTNGLAFQPWIEAEYMGGYVGYWGSNLSEELNAGDTWENDFYVGYRNSVAGFNYDVAYTWFYNNRSGVAAGEEVSLKVSYAINDQLSLGAKVAYDPAPQHNTDVRIFANYKLDDKLSFNAVAGKKNHGGREFYVLGATYALNDDYAVSLKYQDTARTGGAAGYANDKIVVALDYTFSFK
ncbi:TorF family putative porin [Falsigemmobacter faecalis]|uniref:Porin n=1 Tax=Falsigemmobacter faecalis TaxID=2488730 RepID=A0A3P3DLF8_9RHOB|nr:TorF family putative porin [Falsigemmobacter faecalis]RRH75090.1 hypothetical protein EG244_08890 [Falsigemmobacter faecalis]